MSCPAPRSTDICWPVPPTPLQIAVERQTIDEGSSQARERLNSLCERLSVGAGTSREKDYVSDLQSSCNSLALQKTTFQVRAHTPSNELSLLLERYLDSCRLLFKSLNAIFHTLVQSGDLIASQTSQSPRIPPMFWLRQLNRDRFNSLSQDWKAVVIKYGLAVTELHRARRLCALSSHPNELAEELCNRGHQNWEPINHPETLLLEAESGLLVREVQEEIAKQMRCPPNNANSVMQLNMGEGKSSVIVPIIAASLAQGEL